MPDAPSTEPLPGEHQSVDGVEIYRVVAGDGTPVVMLHGIPTSSYLWRNVQRPLSARYRTVAPDLLGLGKSAAPTDRSVALDDQAELLARLLDELAIDRIVLVAHDIGGAVAHHFAAANPSRILAMVVMNAVAFADSWPVPIVKMLRAPILGDVASLVPSKPLLARELRRGIYHGDRMTGELFERYYRPVSGLTGRRRFTRFIRGMDNRSAEQALMAYRDADFPRLILWGEDDPFQPIKFGERLHRLWPESRFVPIAEAGHFLQEDQPDRIADEIDRFLRDTFGEEEDA